MLSSEKSIFENYDCGGPCQRKNAAVMVKTMHQNGLHYILPGLYKVISILATIPATSCSAERSFSALRRIKTFLRSTMGQDQLRSIAVINIERQYANKTMQSDMQRIIDTFGCRSNRSSYFFQSSNWYVLSLTSWFCILEMFISIYRNICTILNARTLTARRRKLDVTKESSCAYVTNKFHSGKLCSAPPTKFFPYADADNCQF